MSMHPRQLLQWYLEAGVDEATGDEPRNRYTEAKEPRSVSAALPPAAPPPPKPAAAQSATDLAATARDLAELRRAMESFESCGLKATATTTVFADGNPAASLMVIGEAPGADEDRQGLPFVGVSGKLLDHMLAAIGHDRTNTYITNVLPWRPPGNRKPTSIEVALCVPFLERHIALVDPQCLLLLGGLAASVIFARSEGIMRLRGQWHDYGTGLVRPIPAIATFRPADLLSAPEQKRLVWRDLLTLRQRLNKES